MFSNEIREGNSDYKLSLSFRNSFSEDWKKNYIRNVYENQNQNLIITSEQFTIDTIEQPDSLGRCIKFLKDLSFNVVVVIYLRDQIDWILSDYIQNIKGGGRNSLRMYLLHNLVIKPDTYDLYKLIHSIQSQRIRIIIRPYDRSLLYRNDVTLDFFRNVLGFEESILEQVKFASQSDSNVSRPSVEEIDSILRINQAYYVKHGREIPKNEFEKAMLIKKTMILNKSKYTHTNATQLSLPKKYKL